MRVYVFVVLLAGFLLLLGSCQNGADSRPQSTTLPSTQPEVSQTPDGLEMGPYSMNVTQNSAEVLWVTFPGANSTSNLHITPNAAVDIQAKALPKHPDMLHVAKISGLQPGQTFQYQLVFSNGNQPAGDVAGQFQTAPAANSAVPLRFVVYGDTRTYPERHRAVATAIAGEAPLAFILDSGDLCSNGVVWPLWKAEFFDPAREMLRGATMWPVLGNHERDGVLCSALFDLPGRYYSFDYGNVHVAAIDSELAVKNKTDPDMLAWLEKDLTASHAQWKFVCYHRPTFDVIADRSTFGQDDLLPILQKCDVDMVFNGHTHAYQRFRPIGEPGKKPIIFVVSAGGGAPSYPIYPGPILERNYSGIHYCVYTVTGNTLQMTVKLPDGTLLDHLELVKTNGMFQKQIMDRTITTKFARDAAFLLSGFTADTPAYPVAGQPITLSVSPLEFPEGAKVEIASAVVPPPFVANRPAYSPFIIPPITLTGWKGGEAIADDAPDNLEPIKFTAIAPADLEPPPKNFEVLHPPTLHVSLRVTYLGQTYTADDVAVAFRASTVRRWLESTH